MFLPPWPRCAVNPELQASIIIEDFAEEVQPNLTHKGWPVFRWKTMKCGVERGLCRAEPEEYLLSSSIINDSVFISHPSWLLLGLLIQILSLLTRIPQWSCRLEFYLTSFQASASTAHVSIMYLLNITNQYPSKCPWCSVTITAPPLISR